MSLSVNDARDVSETVRPKAAAIIDQAKAFTQADNQPQLNDDTQCDPDSPFAMFARRPEQPAQISDPSSAWGKLQEMRRSRPSTYAWAIAQCGLRENLLIEALSEHHCKLVADAFDAILVAESKERGGGVPYKWLDNSKYMETSAAPFAIGAPPNLEMLEENQRIT